MIFVLVCNIHTCSKATYIDDLWSITMVVKSQLLLSAFILVQLSSILIGVSGGIHTVHGCIFVYLLENAIVSISGMLLLLSVYSQW